jgi:hypothetical protein
LLDFIQMLFKDSVRATILEFAFSAHLPFLIWPIALCTAQQKVKTNARRLYPKPESARE